MILLFFLLVDFAYSSEINQRRVIYAQNLFRHGIRNPIYNIKPKKSKLKTDGQLLPIGMRQIFNLGLESKEIFSGSLKLISKHYKKNEIKITSTRVERTMMSAESFLYGFYFKDGKRLKRGLNKNLLKTPLKNLKKTHILRSRAALPYKYQPVPIYVLPKNNYLLNSLNSCKGFRIFKVMQLKSHLMLDLAKKTRKSRKIAARYTGSKIRRISIENSSRFGDFLDCQKARGMKSKLRLKAQKDMKLIKNAVMYYGLFGRKEQQIIATQGLLKTFIKSCERMIEGKKIEKLNLISGHDVNIASLLVTLGIVDPLCYFKNNTKNCEDSPNFSSMISMELIAEKNLKKGNEYFIQVKYNNVIVPKIYGEKNPVKFEIFKEKSRSITEADYEGSCEGRIISHNLK